MAQMAEVDRLMIEEYGILLVQMMENAGRNLAELARRVLNGRLTDRKIVVLCGAGLAAAAWSPVIAPPRRRCARQIRRHPQRRLLAHNGNPADDGTGEER
jgi:hypothetical protein